MSQENVEVVRRLYRFWRDRDYSRLADAVHPDVVIDLSRNVFNPGVYRGIDGFRRWVVEQVDEMWDDFRIDPEESSMRATQLLWPLACAARDAAAE